MSSYPDGNLNIVRPSAVHIRSSERPRLLRAWSSMITAGRSLRPVSDGESSGHTGWRPAQGDCRVGRWWDGV